MKIYTTAIFLMMVNLCIALISSASILPGVVETVPTETYNFKSVISENITYSNADIGMYLFGDFPRALIMLGKIFVLAPITLPILLGAAGAPAQIVLLFSLCTYVIYLVGLAQIIMKYSVEGNA